MYAFTPTDVLFHILIGNTDTDHTVGNPGRETFRLGAVAIKPPPEY